jgi:hypothetical protein
MSQTTQTTLQVIAIPCTVAEHRVSTLSEFLSAYVKASVRPIWSPSGVTIAVELESEDQDQIDQWLLAVVGYIDQITRDYKGRGTIKTGLNPSSAPAQITTIGQIRIVELIDRHKESSRQQEAAETYRQVQETVLSDPKNAAVYDPSTPETTAARYVYQMARDRNRVPTHSEAVEAWERSGMGQILPTPDKGWERLLKAACDHCKKTFKPSDHVYQFGMFREALMLIIPERELVRAVKQVKKDGSKRKGMKRRNITCTYDDLDIALICATLSISGKDRKAPRRYGSYSTAQVVGYFTSTKQWTGRGCSYDKAVLIHSLRKRPANPIFKPSGGIVNMPA